MSKITRTCGWCKHISCLADDSKRGEPNVMGGCLLSGDVVVTDDKSCKKWEKWEKAK